MDRTALLVMVAVGGLGCRSRTEAPASRTEAVPTVAATTSHVAHASVWSGDELDLSTWAGHGDGPIGTSEPIQAIEHDPQRRWVMLCQASARGAYGWKLVLGSGTGLALDAVYAVSRDGAHVVVRIDGAVALVDVSRRTATRLRDAGEVSSFSQDGKRVIVSEPGATPHLRRRDIATGATTRVTMPAGDVGFMEADTSGTWVMVAMARRDEDGNGVVRFGNYAWPRAFACPRREPTLADMANDPIEKVWVDTERGTVQDAPNIVRVTGGHVLVQDDTALVLDGKPYGPRDCTSGLSVLGVVESPFATVVNCSRPREPDAITVIGGPGASVLTASGASWSTTRYAPMLPDREYCIALGRDDTCIDLVTGKVHHQPRVPLALGVHEGVEWYAGTPTHLLVGPPDHGPLHWRPRSPDD